MILIYYRKIVMRARNIIFLRNFLEIIFFSIHFDPTDRPLFISEFARKTKDQLGVALERNIFLSNICFDTHASTRVKYWTGFRVKKGKKMGVSEIFTSWEPYESLEVNFLLQQSSWTDF